MPNLKNGEFTVETCFSINQKLHTKKLVSRSFQDISGVSKYPCDFFERVEVTA